MDPVTLDRPLTDEERRLLVLQSYQVLDTEPEEAFDDLVAVASQVCRTPIALVSLVDETRQWFKARVGVDATETPRSMAFCAHAMLGTETMIVGDAREDPRFRNNPLVTDDPHIRFYAGAPLVTEEGAGLGTLCVIDPEPRTHGFDPDQRRVLEALGRQVVRLLELRRATLGLTEALSRVKLLAPLVPVCAWCHSVRDDHDYWSSIDEYLREHAGVESTHGICPSCAGKVDARDRSEA